MVLLIDNYDSFSYNLYQLVGETGQQIKVVKNDELTLEQIDETDPEFMIISPGPGTPANAGICERAILHRAGKSKILGVCLGHQAIVEAFGGKITYAKELMHGRQSDCEILYGSKLFAGLPKSIKVARYHSLAADPGSMPDCLTVTAVAGEEIMAVEHKTLPVYGLQFHPESVMTPCGREIIKRFLKNA